MRILRLTAATGATAALALVPPAFAKPDERSPDRNENGYVCVKGNGKVKDDVRPMECPPHYVLTPWGET